MNDINIKAGLVAGFIASITSSLILLILTSLSIIPEFNFITVQGTVFGLAGTVLSTWIVYFFIGIVIWGTLYAAVEHKLSGNSSRSKGLLFGFIIWLIVMTTLMPLGEVGFFASKYGFIAAAIVLLTDLTFGATIGYFYEKLRRDGI